MFYAVVLWFCAGQITGAVLLGQLTAVTLLLGLGWQTLTVRREKTPVYQQTPVVLTPEVVTDWAKNRLNQLRLVPDESVRPIRLQKRTLGESSAKRLTQRLDPRRRPVYEYEFVEDGVLATLPEPSAALTLEALIEEPPAALEPATEPDYTAPPSAEAEILSVETAEVEEAGDRSAEDKDVEGGSEAELEEALEEVVSEEISEEVSEEVSEELQDTSAVAESDAALDQSVAEPPDVEQAAASQSEADSFTIDRSEKTRGEAVTARVKARSPDLDEEWGDALLETDEVISSSPDGQKAREKPGLLAAPLILVGWVRDVITSLTKPKPAKPVIDIPRRSPPADPPSSRSPLPEAPPPMTAEPTDEPDEDDWEESNWDD